MKRNDSPVTITGAAKPGPAANCTALWNRVCSPSKRTNCLGRLCRDDGQSRVPEPPHRMTGVINALFPFGCSSCLPTPNLLAAEPSKLSLARPMERSEEHTSELQSLMRISYAVFCLKKKKTSYT